jgi:hypothetical protein
MIHSGEDIAEIRCFLVGLVTGDNWQYDHGDKSHKRVTGDTWQYDHGDNSPKGTTGDNWQNTMEMTVNAGRQDHAATDAVEDWDQRQSCLCMR